MATGRFAQRRHLELHFGITHQLALATAIEGGALVVGSIIVGLGTLPAEDLFLAGAIALLVEGRQRPRFELSLARDVPRLAVVSVAAVLLVAPAGVLTNRTATAMDLMLVGLILFTCITVGRAASHSTLRWLRQAGVAAETAVLLGSGPLASRLLAEAEAHPELGLVISGELEIGPTNLPGPSIETVIIADGIPDHDARALARRASAYGSQVLIVEPPSGANRLSGTPEVLRSVPLVRVSRARRPGTSHLKRAIDIVVASVALLVLLPLMLAFTLLLRRETGARAILRQDRVGQGGRQFSLLKFQTLVPVDELQSQTHWTIAHDQRIGPIGHFLRGTGLDELPQLLNVLRGDMSLVGPRPERPFFVQQFSGEIPNYAERHRVPVGITGWAQVHGLRGDTSIEERARFDNAYCEMWTGSADLKIVLATIPEVLHSRGK